MRIIQSKEFDSYWEIESKKTRDIETEKSVEKIIEDVREKGDAAVRKYASKFDRSSPQRLEVPLSEAKRAYDELGANDAALIEALELAAEHIKTFCEKQKEQFANFDYNMEAGLITGQLVIPIEKAAIYIPSGRYKYISSVLMCMIPAFCAGVQEVVLSSPPMHDGLPDRNILAASWVAAETCGVAHNNVFRIFAIGGAQAIAALALGTESVPRVDFIAGPGNKYVAAAKRLLFGEVGIDFIAGPTDVLIITDGSSPNAAEIVAADMLGQAEHDPDARARTLVPSIEFANHVIAALERQLTKLSTGENARASLGAGGLIIVYETKEEAISIANTIAPEHLELQTHHVDSWIPSLKNFGSLFIGEHSAEVLGDYSAGINHTLPTSASARFTGGLSVRSFLKIVTTLRCSFGDGFEKTRHAAEVIARAEGLEGHAQSAAVRK